jgi:hypothetical protein
MISKEDLINCMNDVYRNLRENCTDDIVVLLMDTNSAIGNMVASLIPSVLLGIDEVKSDEMVVSALSLSQAITLFEYLDNKYGGSNSAMLKVPPQKGHFWCISFSDAGKQMAIFPIPPAIN